MTESTCTKIVRRGDTGRTRNEACGKPAKGEHEGQPLCGLHLRVYVEQEKKANHRSAYRSRVASISDRLGIPLSGWDPMDPVRVRIEKLEELADRLGL